MTPPVLTFPESVRLSCNGSLTFTDNPTWRAAITAVRLGGLYLTVTRDYTITAGSITILGSVISKIGTYDVTIEATGYDDVEGTIDYVVCDWSTLTLVSYADTVKVEPVLVDNSIVTTDIIAMTKTMIEDDICSRFTDLQERLDGLEADVVIQDNIRDIKLLKKAAVSLVLSNALHAGRVTDEDIQTIKSQEYKDRYVREFHRWCQIAPIQLTEYPIVHGVVRLVQ